MGLCCFICLLMSCLWFLGARLQKLYTSWENNPDIGFVAMKVKNIYAVFRYWIHLHVIFLGGKIKFSWGYFLLKN